MRPNSVPFEKGSTLWGLEFRLLKVVPGCCVATPEIIDKGGAPANILGLLGNPSARITVEGNNLDAYIERFARVGSFRPGEATGIQLPPAEETSPPPAAL